MTQPAIGAVVRLYDPSSDCFDEGQIIAIEDAVATVEFCDWQQTWPIIDLQLDCSTSARPFFEPHTTGVVTQRFPVGRTK